MTRCLAWIAAASLLAVENSVVVSNSGTVYLHYQEEGFTRGETWLSLPDLPANVTLLHGLVAGNKVQGYVDGVRRTEWPIGSGQIFGAYRRWDFVFIAYGPPPRPGGPLGTVVRFY